MYYYLYKTTNNINGDYYYGVHSTEELNDKYLGSGPALVDAIRQFGSENFSKQVIKCFDTVEEAYKMESEVVDDKLVNDPHCYNMTRGGRGSKPGANKNRIHSEKSRNNMRIAFKKRIEKYGSISSSPEIEKKRRQKISNYLRTRECSQETREKLRESNIGKKHNVSPEGHQSMSKAKKGRHWKVVDGKRVWYD